MAYSKPQKLLLFLVLEVKNTSHKHAACEIYLLPFYECVVQYFYISVHIQGYFKIQMYAFEMCTLEIVAKSDSAKRMTSETLDWYYFAEKSCAFF